MDDKGEKEEITFPKIYFAIDDFEQVSRFFSSFLVFLFDLVTTDFFIS